MVWIPRNEFLDWPKSGTNLTPEKLKELYSNGFAGAKPAPSEVMRAFRKIHSWPDGAVVTNTFGLTNTGAGKLTIPFVHVIDMFPGCWPGPAQSRGDCVSHSTKNAALLTMCCDIVSNQPDEKTGKLEGKPDVPEEGIKNGVLSTEAFYWWRGYDGDGWFCHEAANIAASKSGLWVRRNYPEIGVDLTTYSGKVAGLYGSRKPEKEVEEIGRQHLIHQATDVNSFEDWRDLLTNGYGLSTCGSEGFSDERDENGVSRREGSWPHAMGCIGVDDRDVIKEKYNDPLCLILNSWSIFNRGPRDIFESANLVPPDKKDRWIEIGLVNPQTGNIMIPEGSFWAKWKEVSHREAIAFSGANGWPRKELPDFGTYVW